MLLSDLKIGDIIITGDECDSLPLHVAMYTGHIDGRPYITHCFNGNPGGLKTTVLEDFGKMFIFRPADANLGAKAADLMLKWAKFAIPYDLKRARWMRHTHFQLRSDARQAGKDPTDYLLEYLEVQSKAKFYERIKFAARRDVCPVNMLEGVAPRGFTCVQVVILAYQIAEISNLVKPLAEIGNVWISDKHCAKATLRDGNIPKSYARYASKLRQKDEFPKFEFNDKKTTTAHNNIKYLSSLNAWRYDLEPSLEKFIGSFESCLNLPSKICFTDALQSYLLKNSKYWINKGVLEYKSLPPAVIKNPVIQLQKYFVNQNVLSWFFNAELGVQARLQDRTAAPMDTQLTVYVPKKHIKVLTCSHRILN